MNESGFVFFIVFAVILLITVLFLFFKFFFDAIEQQFAHMFHRPFYVHFYLFKKKLPDTYLEILNREFPFYQKLSDKRKQYFEHRMMVFLENHEFVGMEGFLVDTRSRVLIAATSTMLTFGMRSYLYTHIKRVLIYPEVYYSTITQNYHKGEFNPSVKAIVFSWKAFEHGFLHVDDNLNLGIHEFAHALHFQGMKNDNVSSYLFLQQFKRIQKEVAHLPNQERLLESDFFRKYAYTNQFEFIAVVLEYFFESPQEFKSEFPHLFLHVKRMINFGNYTS
jgi:Mlc titration factor MtfA (ptsG expression regulator)